MKKNNIYKNISEDIFPKIKSSLLTMRKKKIIFANDSDIIKCAKKQTHNYAASASNYISHKVIKSAQDTLIDVFDDMLGNKEKLKKLKKDKELINKAITMKNNPLLATVGGAGYHGAFGASSNVGFATGYGYEVGKRVQEAVSNYENELYNWQKSGYKGAKPTYKPPIVKPLKGFNVGRLMGYGAVRELGAHAINKVKPDMPYEAKYGISSAVAAPILVPNAPAKGKLLASAVMGILGTLTSYINKKDLQRMKKNTEKEIEKTKSKKKTIS